MQQGYEYTLTAPAGADFAPGFAPELTPAEMLELGVFGGKYLTDCRDEFPDEWFEHAHLCHERHDPELNFFGVNASLTLARLAGARLDSPRRPARLVPVVLPLLDGTPGSRRGRAPDQVAGRR